jgi:sporulation protein YlmC with PRC-barrel domain
MKMTSRNVLMASAVSVVLALSMSPVLADSSTTTNAQDTDVNTNMGVSAIDAGKLIDKDVYDAKGDKIGSIESVIVDTSGKVTSVVLNVGGWLSSDKRIFVAWKNLQSSPDGKITSNLTKDQAQAAADYKYQKDQNRGKVSNTSGDLVTADSATGAGAPTTNQSMTNGTTSQTASTTTFGTPVKNADGSLNASQVIGTKVVNDQNESVGKIGEIVLGQNGKPSGVVVDVGGFLGIGTHPVLLDWKQVSLVDQDGSTQAVVKMSKDELKQMPEYSAH